MPTRRTLVLALTASTLSLGTGCWATMIKRSPDRNPRGNELMWGFVFLDVFLGLWVPPIPVGLIFDFATGAIYRPYSDMRRSGLPYDDTALEEVVEAVELAVCSQAEALARSTAEAPVRGARALRDHVQGCTTCAGALSALEPIVHLPPSARRAVGSERLSLRLPAREEPPV